MTIEITKDETAAAVTPQSRSTYLDSLFTTGHVPARNAGGDAAVPDSQFADETVFTTA
jgi:hypothetical protein